MLLLLFLGNEEQIGNKSREKHRFNIIYCRMLTYTALANNKACFS